jgi:hypothetical protein
MGRDCKNLLRSHSAGVAPAPQNECHNVLVQTGIGVLQHPEEV